MSKSVNAIKKTSRMLSNSSKLSTEKVVLAIIYATVFVVSFIVVTTLYDQLHYPNAIGLSDSKWHREVILGGGKDNAQMVLRWNITNTSIVMEAIGKTTGYLGIGFSKSTSMKGADIVYGWVKDGKAFLQDCHTTHNSAPLIDAQQDYHLVHGAENDTHTVLRFTRNLATCDDEHDYKLTKDSTKLIWVIGAEDPADELGITKQFHEPDSNNHGFRTVLLYNPNRQPVTLGNGTHFVDLTFDKVRIPDGALTFYYCHFFKLPEFKTKHQLFGYDPLLEPKNIPVIHHLLIRECRGKKFIEEFENYDGEMGFQCPNYQEQTIDPMLVHCQEVLVGYAAGNEGLVYPVDVGTPLGEEFGGPSYVMMEIHYHNSKYLSGIIDSSGLRLYYTSQLRKYDSGVLYAGNGLSAFNIIPPGQKEFPIIGYCSQTCLNKRIPETGINVIIVLLHTHLLGRKIIARHFRDGVELPPIAKDEHYDFNYQETRILHNQIKILPNDSISIDCYYDTTSRTETVMGGEKSIEEMCLAFLVYYPKMDLHVCASIYPMQEVVEVMGAKLASDSITVIDERNEGKTVDDFVKTYNWNERGVKEFHRYVMHGEMFPLCVSDDLRTVMDMPKRITRPPFVEYHQPNDNECEQPYTKELN